MGPETQPRSEPGPLLARYIPRSRASLVAPERWLNAIRLGVTLLVTAAVALQQPAGSAASWVLVVLLYLTVTVVAIATTRARVGAEPSRRTMVLVGAGATAVDAGVALAFLWANLHTSSLSSLWILLLVPTVELAWRHGTVGGVTAGVVGGVVSVAWILSRSGPSGPGYVSVQATFALGLTALVGAVVGMGIHRIDREATILEQSLDLSEELMEERRRTIANFEKERERLRMILELTSMSAWEYDFDHEKLRLPRPARRFAGIESARDVVTAREFTRRVHPDDRERFVSSVASAMRGSMGEIETEFRVEQDGGEWAWIRNRVRALLDDEGRPARVVGVAMDVTSEREAREALARSQTAYRLALASMTDAFMATDAEGRITDWNQAAEAMYGWSREEILGRPLVGTLSPEEHVPRWGQLATRGLEISPGTRLPAYRAEGTGLHKNGRTFPVEVLAVSVSVEGRASLQVFVRDISERKAAEAELEKLALFDSLTGLPNRSLLMDRLVRAINGLARHPAKLVVMFIDIDRFKVVNDSHGHATGDRLLITVGRRIASSARASDTVARFGGDEFVVLCEEVADEAQAAELANRVLESISVPLRLDDGREVVLTASAGIAMTDDPESDPVALVRDADAAMYRAKEHGRARFEMFDEAMRSRAMAQLEIESDLRRALAEERFTLVFQPVVSLAEGHVKGIEALIRWNHPTRGVVSPMEFIPLAEETGLIVPIGTWVLEEACRRAAAWAKSGSSLATLDVAVNLSPRQLTDQDLPAAVASVLADQRLDASALSVEITETAFMEAGPQVTTTLQRLRDLGVKVLLDDFGTGYESLGYLRDLPIDGLKLDASFVAGVGKNLKDTAIIEGVVHMARLLELQVVAEGVERKDQRDVLRDIGCALGQGSYWCSATSVERLEAVVERLGVAAAPRKSRAG